MKVSEVNEYFAVFEGIGYTKYSDVSQLQVTTYQYRSF